MSVLTSGLRCASVTGGWHCARSGQGSPSVPQPLGAPPMPPKAQTLPGPGTQDPGAGRRLCFLRLLQEPRRAPAPEAPASRRSAPGPATVSRGCQPGRTLTPCRRGRCSHLTPSPLCTAGTKNPAAQTRAATVPGGPQSASPQKYTQVRPPRAALPRAPRRFLESPVLCARSPQPL